jgi:hypothetical protein
MGVEVHLYPFFNLGARWWWVVNATPRPLYPRERPGTLCIGGWVSLRAGLNGCGKCRPHRYSIPGPSNPLRVAVPNELSGPTTAFDADSKQVLCVAECASAAWYSASVPVLLGTVRVTFISYETLL